MFLSSSVLTGFATVAIGGDERRYHVDGVRNGGEGESSLRDSFYRGCMKKRG